ncbi:outer membrane beta-barrel protein [Larkinella punicea]|uniref:PorT family protein n=1 Tax=Larkinella punicea TaxID=2315727 RepID=A0A368JPS7_9BACT|nr:OmpW family outer membrane protein [Larkinella punicea]RCR69677.1 PorT family protein [Larkinella punicea]
MKTIAFTLVVMGMVFSEAVAQTEKGRWQIGAQLGNVTYQSDTSNASKSISGSLAPAVGYFIARNLLIGVTVPFSFNATNLKYGADHFNRTIGIGPAVRYYVGQSSFKPFVGISYTYARSYGKWRDLDPVRSESITKGYSRTLAPAIGVAYFINRHVLLSAGLSYNLHHREGESRNTTPTNVVSNRYSEDLKTWSLGIGFAVLLGE